MLVHHLILCSKSKANATEMKWDCVVVLCLTYLGAFGSEAGTLRQIYSVVFPFFKRKFLFVCFLFMAALNFVNLRVVDDSARETFGTNPSFPHIHNGPNSMTIQPWTTKHSYECAGVDLKAVKIDKLQPAKEGGGVHSRHFLQFPKSTHFFCLPRIS
jgi:hypothetical protein